MAIHHVDGAEPPSDVSALSSTAESRVDEAPHAAAGPLLEVQNVEVVYNEISLAVRGISLSVPTGGVVALLGANGAGKTTTIRAISGLLDINNGRVRDGDIILDGQSVKKLRPHEIVGRGVAQVPEGRKIFGHLTVEENLRVGASARKDRRNVGTALEQVYELFPPIAARRHDEAGWMSGGEQQMVAVGRALMAAPRLLLLDELSLGLAPLVVDAIFERLDQTRKELGVAMLLVEQNAQIALEFSEYGYIMENGRIVLDGPSAELQNNSDVQEFYLGISESQETKSYASVKHYKRRKRWV
jgi:branched-chain amino acid transport system ATP-binding protein